MRLFLASLGLVSVAGSCSPEVKNESTNDGVPETEADADLPMQIDVLADTVSLLPGQTVGVEIQGLEADAEARLGSEIDGVTVQLDSDSDLKVKVAEDVAPGSYDAVVLVSAPGFIDASDDLQLVVTGERR